MVNDCSIVENFESMADWILLILSYSLKLFAICAYMMDKKIRHC